MFKLQNPLVILDLEATAGEDSKGHQTNDWIIDIGAVCLNEKLEILGTYSSLVKPREPITEFITKLTGIRPEDVESKPGFEVIGPEFLNWVQSLCGNPKKARLGAWGNYFDIPLLRKNYQAVGLDFPFSGTALDVKTLGFLWCSLSGRRTDKFQLETLAADMGISPEGTWHRALTDAHVTALVLKRVWQDLQGVFIPGKADEPFKHFELHPSL